MFLLFINYTATTEIYTLSLHDALPILRSAPRRKPRPTFASTGGMRSSPSSVLMSIASVPDNAPIATIGVLFIPRSEEHTSELQSRLHLVCRLLLEKKKYKYDSKKIQYQ